MPTLTRQWYDQRPSLERLDGVSVETSGGDRVVDLKGGIHTLGELHLSLQEHSWIIRNGTLTDGDVLVGPRIEGRRVAFQNVTLNNVTLRCTEELQCDFSFDRCTELKDCKLQADRITLIRCKSIERTELAARELTLKFCWSLRGDDRIGIAVSGTVRIESEAGESEAPLRTLAREFRSDAAAGDGAALIGVSVVAARGETAITTHTFTDLSRVNLRLVSALSVPVDHVISEFKRVFAVGRNRSHVSSRFRTFPNDPERLERFLLGERAYTRLRLDEPLAP